MAKNDISTPVPAESAPISDTRDTTHDSPEKIVAPTDPENSQPLQSDAL